MDDNIDLLMINGEMISVRDIESKLFSSALFYGTGCFETMRFEKGRIHRFDDHISRLYLGLKYLELPKHLFPEKEFIYQKISQSVNESGYKDKIVKIRIQCSLLEQKGYHLDPDVQLLTHIRINEYEIQTKPGRLLIAKTRVIPSDCRPSDLKLSNMLHYRSAFREAIKENYDDSLMLTLEGNIAETSMANIFWAIGYNVFTPSLECSILPGIMRKTIIKMIKRSDHLSIEEGIFNMDSLLKADFVWLSNSIIEFQPVKSIDNFLLKSDEALYKVISKAIHEINWNTSNP